MMKMIIKKKNLLFLFAVLVIAMFSFNRGSIIKLFPQENKKITLQTFEREGGWGYRIMIAEKVFVYQPTIPAVSSEIPFPSKESAQAVGELVMNRLKSNLSISVTHGDIQHILFRAGIKP